MKAFKLILINILIFLVALSPFEVIGQILILIRPSYEVLFLQPDKVVGWKQVPNFQWTWAGQYWYAADFSVPIKTNALGFRDRDRPLEKPHGVIRVALLGDSFIEAVQVPFEKTAGHLLEQRLNAAFRNGPTPSRKYEVLNFGISHYGVGQYLLTWEEYASKYAPDYVAIFVAKLHMERTVNKYKHGEFRSTAGKRLWVRPIFRLENDVLIREPAKDFDEFVELQEALISTRYAGKRMRTRKRWVSAYYAKQLWDRLASVWERMDRSGHPQHPLEPEDDVVTLPSLLAINLKIIEELGRKVHAAGSRLVVVDVSQYFGDEETIAKGLEEICRSRGFGYIPLYEHLLHANRSGLSTRWTHDGHFNEAGNMILADVVQGWMAKHAAE